MEKMMIPDNYKPIRQVGNGKTVSFSFDFPMLSENFIKVYREQDGVQELVDPSEYVWGYIPVEGEDAPVEDIAPENVITFYEAPADGVVIVIAREIPLEQTTPYKTSSGFPAVRVEDNFDKLTAITQQLMEEVDRCVKVEITGDQTPEELLAEVYGKLDSATEVAQDAIEAAKQAQIAADNATSAVEEAEQQVADTKVYVDSAKADIDNTVALAKSDIESTKDSTIAVVTSTSASAVATIEQTVAGGKQEINTTIEEAQTSLSDTIAQAVEDVKAEATKAAEDAIQNAADEATQVATKQTIEYVENTAIPAISAVKDSAVSELENVLAADKSTLEGYVQVASDSVAISTQRASEAAESASIATQKANEAKASASAAKTSEANAKASEQVLQNLLPNQSANAGKYLTTNGTNVSWGSIPNEIPSQSGNSGKYLTTNGTTTSWADVSSGRNVGDIFYTSRTDTELNGAVECNGATYNTNDFTGSESIGALLLSKKLPYISLSQYANQLSANGSCRAFGWDGGTAFRVPTIPALLLTKEQSAVVGNGMTLGLTDGTKTSGLYGTGADLNANTGIYGAPIGTKRNGDQTTQYLSLGVATDPTKSGIVANLDVVEYRAMVQLANKATDEAIITATSALQQIANKVDKTSATDRATVIGWSMPDYSAGISVTTPTSSSPFIAPKDGIYVLNGVCSNTQVDLYINGIKSAYMISSGSQYRDSQSMTIFMSKNDSCYLNGNITTKSQAFYPLKGAN